jgi:16S rRNA processing protein RimM
MIALLLKTDWRKYLDCQITIPKADVDEYYWSDLKGLTVLGLNDDEEVNLGQIMSFLKQVPMMSWWFAPRLTVLMLKTNDSWHKDVVQRVDLEAGRIYVNWGVDY